MGLYRTLRTRAARAGLHRPVGWLRNFGIDPNDVLLASHGRSGSSMLRFILAEILSGVPSTFDTIQRIVPEVGLQFHTYPTLPGSGRLIKTHEPYCREYKRAIYIVRDVRDVLLSSYKREMAVGCIFTSLDDFIRRFIEGRMSHWGSWQSHAESWINSPLAASGNLLVVRYEDMRKDPERTVRQSLEFLGKSAEASVIQAAIRNNSLERMRDKEQRSKRMVKIKGDGRQVNSGMIERWRTMLTPQQLAMVDEYAGKMRERFGYPTGAGSLSAKHNAPEIGPRLWESHSHEQRGGNFTGRGLQKFSPIDLENAEHPAAHRNLRVRVGGRIANLFSWYPY